MPDPLRYLSVCAGIEAASVAWAPLGWQPVLLSEIDPFPRAVLAHRWNAIDAARAGCAELGVPLWGDFVALRVRHLRRLGVALPDILVGGTPCQGFSIAGLRKSLDDDRSNLALAFCKLANAIDNARRRAGLPGLIVVWENVPGVFSTPDNAFGCFLAAMVGADAPLVPGRRQRWTSAGLAHGPRRAAAWRVLDAQHFGLAQRRERVFLVACPRDGPDPSEILFERQGSRRDPAPRPEAREDVARPIAGGTPGGSGYRNDPDTAENLIAAFNNTGQGWWNDADVAATVRKGDDGGGGGAREATLVADTLRSHPHPGSNSVGALAFGGNRQSGPLDVATAVRAKGGTGHGDFESETFVVAGALQAGGKAAGSATSHDAESGLLVAHTLRADGFDASEDGTGRGTPLVAVGFRTSPNCGAWETGDRTDALTTGTDQTSIVVGFTDRDADAGTVAVFDPTQITNPNNRSQPKPGPSHTHTLPANGYAPVAFTCKDSGADAGDISPTLRAMNFDGSHANGGGQVAVAYQESQSGVRSDDVHATLDANNGSRRHNGAVTLSGVRRLMPTECARLQGFPDSYLDITYRGKPAADGPKYRAYGNSMAVPVVRWIGRRIATALGTLT